jgi:hypothetical protein
MVKKKAAAKKKKTAKVKKKPGARKKTKPSTARSLAVTVVVPTPSGREVEDAQVAVFRKTFAGCDIQFLPTAAALENWTALIQAAPRVQTPWVFLAAGESSVNPGLVKRMLARTGEADLILAQRGPMPTAAAALLKMAWRLPNLELGSGVLLRSKSLSDLAARYGQGDSLVGARMVRAALASGQRIVVEKFSKDEVSLGALDALGLHPLYFKRRLKNIAMAAVIGFLLVSLGTGVVHPKNATLGLAMISMGMLLMASLAGKEE